jgi:DNA-binding transcriptional LysR family regulator
MAHRLQEKAPALPSVGRDTHPLRRTPLALVPTPRPTPSTSARFDVNPRLLRCFVAVAEELHFGRAADRMYVAQPALSRRIQQLERMLGRQLFVRTTRTVELTPSERELLPAAREVLDSLQMLADDLSAPTTLRVAHVPCADTAALILDVLAQSDPALRVEETR